MEFGLYLSEIEKLRLFDEIFKTVLNMDKRRISESFNRDIEIKAMVRSFSVMKKNFKRIIFEYLYFGQEFCEELIPTLKDVTEAISLSRNRNWKFVYVTGPVTENGLKRQIRILNFLNKKKEKIEVVVNDLGILNIMKNYKNIQPILGRMLIKLKKMPRFSKKMPSPDLDAISIKHHKKIWRNQLSYYRNTNLNIDLYKRHLLGFDINRCEVDMVPRGIDFNSLDGFLISLYFPWSYVAFGRNCEIGVLDNPLRKYYSISKNCSKPCEKYLILLKAKFDTLPIMQSGNAIFMNSIEIFEKYYMNDNIIFNRLIYEPFLPI